MNLPSYLKRLSILCILPLMGVGCFSTTEEPAEPVVLDRDAILMEAKENGLIMTDEEVAGMATMTVEEDMGQSGVALVQEEDRSDWFAAALADVTGGDSFGIAHARFQNGQYMMIAEMGNLPVLESDYFYEGWIVRRGKDMSVISTGKAELVDGEYINAFKAFTDLTDHDFYVLTLEPDDGDPAPAEHILEGTLK